MTREKTSKGAVITRTVVLARNSVSRVQLSAPVRHGACDADSHGHDHDGHEDSTGSRIQLRADRLLHQLGGDRRAMQEDKRQKMPTIAQSSEGTKNEIETVTKMASPSFPTSPRNKKNPSNCRRVKGAGKRKSISLAEN